MPAHKPTGPHRVKNPIQRAIFEGKKKRTETYELIRGPQTRAGVLRRIQQDVTGEYVKECLEILLARQMDSEVIKRDLSGSNRAGFMPGDVKVLTERALHLIDGGSLQWSELDDTKKLLEPYARQLSKYYAAAHSARMQNVLNVCSLSLFRRGGTYRAPGRLPKVMTDPKEGVDE